MPGPYRIDLVKQETVLSAGTTGYRLQITAQAPVNMSEKVFVYRKTALNNDVFEGVCSPGQLNDLPADIPDPDLDDPNHFRKATFDRTYTDADDLADGWLGVYTSTDHLLNLLDIIDKFTAALTYRIGTSVIVHGTDTFIQP